MTSLPENNDGQPESTTSSFLKGPIKIVIDWDIPNFSTLKDRTEEMESKIAVVGTSAWSIVLQPVNDIEEQTADENHPVEVAEDAGPVVGVYLKRKCLANDVSNIQAFFEFSVTDDADQRHIICEKDSTPDTFMAVVEQWGGSYIPHADLWGSSPKYVLKNDTLRIRAEIQYALVKQAELKDPMEPLRKMLITLYDSKVGKDFELVSSEGTTYSVHRAILSATSPVFCSMLQSGMTEAKNGRCTMPDVSGDTLELMLDYMYDNSTERMDKLAKYKNVLIAADKYQMTDLKAICEKLLVADITSETAADLLIVADTFSAPALKAAALDHVVKNLQAMTSSGQLKNLSDGGDSALIQEVFAAVARHGAEITGVAKKAPGKSKKRKTSG